MRRELLFLWEMIRSIDRIQKSFEQASSAGEALHCDAMLWNFTVLGEAVAQISREFKDQYPHVDWVSPTRLRNRIVHGYRTVDFGVLLEVATNFLPGFRSDIEAIWGEVAEGRPGPVG